MSQFTITDARVVDVRTGRVRPGEISISDGRITGIAEPGVRHDHASTLSAGGRFVIPGIVTVHTHLSIVFPFADTDLTEAVTVTRARAIGRATAALAAGATTVRCIHEQNQIDLDLLAEPPAERLPRIVPGGRALGTPGGHGEGTGAVLCSGAAAFATAAAAELDAGARHLKVFITGGLAHAGEDPAAPEMTFDEMAAVVRMAQQYDAPVVAHAGHHRAIRTALDAGITSFEHAYDVDEATAELLARPGVFVSPTLLVSHSPATMDALGFEEHSRANAARVAPVHLASIRRLIAAGVRLTLGTDYPPGQVVEGTSAVATEALLLQRAGLSPLEALQAATLNGAEVCRIDDRVGVIEPGYAADLLLLHDDPTHDISAVARIDTVIAGGEIVSSR